MNFTKSMNGFARTAIALLLVVSGSQALAAGTAANARLQNSVTATYKNLTGDAQTPVVATAEITVLLLASTPNLEFVSSTPNDLSTLSEGQAISIDYRVTSTANGPDDYDLTTTETDADNDLDASTFTSPTDVGELGATIVVEDYTILATAGSGAGECTTAGTGSCTIKVANDDASGGAVNGFSAFDTIFFSSIGSGVSCTVTAVDDTNGGEITDVTVGTGYSTITFSGCTAAGALSVADGAFESKVVTFNLTTTTVTGANTVGDADLSTTARDDNATAVASASVDNTITVYAARMIIHKLVQNLTSAATGTTTDPGNDGSGNQIIGILSADDGTGSTTYYKAGVTAKPGETLQYVVLVQNLGSEVNDVIVTDALNVFTTYTPGSIRVMEEGDLDCTTNNANAWDCDVTIDTGTTATVQTPADAANDNDGGSYDGGTATVNIFAGIGGDDDSTTGGVIGFGKVSLGFYSVTVN